MRPEDPTGYLNLGWLYRDVGDSQEALESTKKSLEINPTNILALMNITIIYIDLGDIEKAIKYSQKAAKLEPQNPRTQYNLAYCHEIANNLGKAFNHFNESANRVHKEKLWVSISSLISSCLILFQVGKVEESFKYLQIAKQIVANAVLGMEFTPIKHKNADLNYIKYLSALHNDSETGAQYDSQRYVQKIIHIGDSNSLSFINKVIFIDNKPTLIIPSLIKGAKAFHLKAHTGMNRFKYAFEKRIENDLSDYRYIFISFGTNDCLLNEGIISYCRKYCKDISMVAIETARELIDYIFKSLQDYKNKLIIFGIAAPVPSVGPEECLPEVDKERIQAIKVFNRSLLNECNRLKISFADVYNLTSDGQSCNNKEWMIDEFHLKKNALEPLLNEFKFN